MLLVETNPRQEQLVCAGVASTEHAIIVNELLIVREVPTKCQRVVESSRKTSILAIEAY